MVSSCCLELYLSFSEDDETFVFLFLGMDRSYPLLIFLLDYHLFPIDLNYIN